MTIYQFGIKKTDRRLKAPAFRLETMEREFTSDADAIAWARKFLRGKLMTVDRVERTALWRSDCESKQAADTDRWPEHKPDWEPAA